MALQDLTPQLRTRLSRLERVVGLFVLLASLLLLAGLAYYIYQTAASKGWFLRKLPYYTYTRSAAGLKVGQPVRLMGLDVGEITDIQPMPPGSSYDMFVAFRVKEDYYGYLWDDSRARIGAVDFLGNRSIEVTKGTNGVATYLFRPFREAPLSEVESLVDNGPVLSVDEIYDETKVNVLVKPTQPITKEILQRIQAAGSVTSLRIIDTTNSTKAPTGLWDYQTARYLPPNRKGYFLSPDESPALTERLETLVGTVEAALPGVLSLTNQLQRVLDNSADATARADQLLTQARPIVANLNQLSAQLASGPGALGDWLIPTNLTPQLAEALANANSILTNSDARLTTLAADLDRSLENLANITGNLHAQVNANTNLVREISTLIINTDDLVQGLKRHWLLRSAFKKPPAPATSSKVPPARSPKDER